MFRSGERTKILVHGFTGSGIDPNGWPLKMKDAFLTPVS